MKKMAQFLAPALPWVASAFLACTFLACNKQGEKASATPPPATSNANAGFVAPATPPVVGELVMTAEVLEIPGQFPANDLYNYAYTMKYKVLQVIQGSYADTTILIGHYNPRIARSEIKDDQDAKVGGDVKSFQVGDIHYLVLSALDGVWTGAIEDDYFKDKRPRYWALWTDKAK
jgi:hypothetical protein